MRTRDRENGATFDNALDGLFATEVASVSSAKRRVARCMGLAAMTLHGMPRMVEAREENMRAIDAIAELRCSLVSARRAVDYALAALDRKWAARDTTAANTAITREIDTLRERMRILDARLATLEGEPLTV